MTHISSAIDRYLNGRMSAQEQTEFAAQLAADPTLRATLEAEQLIRSTVRNDIAAFPPEHALTRSRVMESLATVKVPVGVSAGAAAWYSSGALLKGLLGIIAVAGLSVGGYIWMQQSNNTPEQESLPIPISVAPQPSVVPEPHSVPNSLTTEPKDVAPLAKPFDTTPAENSGHRATNKIKKDNPSSQSTYTVSANTAVAQPQPTVSATTEGTTLQSAPRPPAGARQIRVLNKDSVKLKVQVKVK